MSSANANWIFVAYSKRSTMSVHFSYTLRPKTIVTIVLLAASRTVWNFICFDFFCCCCLVSVVVLVRIRFYAVAWFRRSLTNGAAKSHKRLFHNSICRTHSIATSLCKLWAQKYIEKNISWPPMLLHKFWNNLNIAKNRKWSRVLSAWNVEVRGWKRFKWFNCSIA